MSSEALLLAKLGIFLFSYGLVVQSIDDGGSVFDPAVLDLTQNFSSGVSTMAGLSYTGCSSAHVSATPQHWFHEGRCNSNGARG
ncbi:hypothetical protein GOP47_0031090 [Adiantum capillus-veneris]|nr:hypothetical protein GOP47_0031090 [Adiantum capillus-veneris]